MNKKLLFRLVALVTAMMCALGMQAAEAYANYTPSNTTLTFYYDNLRSSRTGTTYNLNTGSNSPDWKTDGTNASVTRVVFNPSFAEARPTTTYSWFANMENLTEITGISYLNTSEVTHMGFMFYGCDKLTSVDVCHFNTAKVTSMSAMFRDCSSLTSLDLGGFNPSQVTHINYMFFGCSNLHTIYAGNDWSTAAVTNSTDMFKYCTSLVGGLGTTYDENHIDAEYAHIDGGTSNPGYFSKKPSFLRGDVNGDNSVNIADVTALINYLLTDDPTGINLDAANCNQDGAVNIADVTTLINFLLTDQW
ncbi:MAG: BspA family leucine-rich repeat surface protein [Muribaculaceae bacterium]|nr:BspA family leucine-rich repeat surface protein [Muribaculaceae bacterium]